MSRPIDWEALAERARVARDHAYAPYSDFRVGAALLDEHGQIFAGANVENVSYGLTLCAERGAVSAAVTAGSRRFVALLLLSDADPPATPCGACRQVLSEFAPGFAVCCRSLDGQELILQSDALLPHPFSLVRSFVTEQG